MRPTKKMLESIEMITSTCEGQAFYSRDFPQALIIGNDSTWIARVSEDGSTEEAYLVQYPAECLSTADGDDNPEHIKGFTTGFTA